MEKQRRSNRDTCYSYGVGNYLKKIPAMCTGCHFLKKAKPAVDSVQRLPYEVVDEISGARQMSGAMFSAEADLTHPLAYASALKR
jgi:hypothetical protein